MLPVQCLEQAVQAVLSGLGNGHSELTYANALKCELAAQRIFCRTEVCCPFVYHGQCVGYGKADIVFDDLIVELKVGTALYAKEARVQILRYLQALQSIEKKRYSGVLLYIDKSNGTYRIIHLDALGTVMYDTAADSTYCTNSADHTNSTDRNVQMSTQSSLSNGLMLLLQKKYRSIDKSSQGQGVPLSRIVRYFEKMLPHNTASTPTAADRSRAIQKFVKTRLRCKMQSKLKKRVVFCYPLNGSGFILMK
jgi:GxxExxY protein